MGGELWMDSFIYIVLSPLKIDTTLCFKTLNFLMLINKFLKVHWLKKYNWGILIAVFWPIINL